MTAASAPPMTAETLIALGREASAAHGCPRCIALVCKGWESVPGGFDSSTLRLVGTLRSVDEEEPTLVEYHPTGTHGWSPDAPIALGWFPYNRCDVWQCVGCGRAFLRYTEFGGYYADERIRELRGQLVVPSSTA